MKNDAKKGLALTSSWGGVEAIVVVSLYAGSDKGETWFPPGALVEILAMSGELPDTFESAHLPGILDLSPYHNIKFQG